MKTFIVMQAGQSADEGIACRNKTSVVKTLDRLATENRVAGVRVRFEWWHGCDLVDDRTYTPEQFKATLAKTYQGRVWGVRQRGT